MKKIKWLVLLLPFLACFYVVAKSQELELSQESMSETTNIQTTYTISTCEELQNMKNDLNGHYTLLNNIDCSGTIHWNNGKGFEPLGYEIYEGSGSSISVPFTGVFDGKGFVIDQLTINRPLEKKVGLFGIGSGDIKNVAIENARIVGGDDTGILVGDKIDGTMRNVSVTGDVEGKENTGGLVGFLSESTLVNADASASVEGTFATGGLIGAVENSEIENLNATGNVVGEVSVGGLAGDAQNTTVSNSRATGKVTGTMSYTGGLVGQFIGYEEEPSSINASFATGEVTGIAYVGGLAGLVENVIVDDSRAEGSIIAGERVGGLVGGLTNATIKNSHATGSVTASDYYIGGLVGLSEEGSVITDSYAEGSLNTSDTDYVGGLVGSITDSIVTKSFAIGDIEGRNNVGGLIGEIVHTDIETSYATGEIMGRNNTGGLIGIASYSNVVNSDATGNVTGMSYVGGLIGTNEHSLVEDSRAEGSIFAGEMVGGLVGELTNGTIKNSHASGDIIATEYSIGGLVGLSKNNSTITDSYAEGSLAADADYMGGLIGSVQDSIIKNSFATGNIEGRNNVGGLIGEIDHTDIETSYATGSVIGSVDFIGGLVGYGFRNSTIKDSYAEGVVNGREGVGGLIGYTENVIIESSHATGEIEGEYFVGGLVGQNEVSFIKESYAEGLVSGVTMVGGLIGTNHISRIETSYATGNVKGENGIGGLIGNNYLSDVANSYAIGNVKGTNQTGGLIGSTYNSNVINSYANGFVDGTVTQGGLIGVNRDSVSTNSYYDKNTSKQNDTGKGTALITAQMKTTNSFVSWDFTNIWTIQTGKNNGYPYLRFREPAIKKPEKVKNVTNTSTSQSIRIGWENPKGSNVSSVIIKRDGVIIARDVTLEIYEDTDLFPSTTYTYEFIVVNGNGVHSDSVIQDATTDGGLAFSFEKVSLAFGSILLNGTTQTRTISPGTIRVRDTRTLPSAYNVSLSSTAFTNGDVGEQLPVSFMLKKQATIARVSGIAPASIASDERWVLNENEGIKLFSILTSQNPSEYTINFGSDAFELTVNTNNIHIDPDTPSNTVYRGMLTWRIVTGP